MFGVGQEVLGHEKETRGMAHVSLASSESGSAPASAMISATLPTRKRMKRMMGWACMPPHSHSDSPPEEIAIIEAAGKIPRNRERERRSADNARLPAAWPFQLHHCLPPPCHIFHSDKRGGREGLGWVSRCL